MKRQRKQYSGVVKAKIAIAGKGQRTVQIGSHYEVHPSQALHVWFYRLGSQHCRIGEQKLRRARLLHSHALICKYGQFAVRRHA